MSRLKHKIRSSRGFTIIELLIVIVILGVLGGSLVLFLNNSYSHYLTLQEDSSVYADLSIQSQRMATVLRGSTDTISASVNDLSVYAYFSPNDTYVSQIHYYINGAGNTVMADVTPMTSNPPIGVPITAQLRSYSILRSYRVFAGNNLFVYLDSAGAALSTPIADLHTIKGIQVNLGVASTASGVNNHNTMSIQVSLRNRKTNL